MIKKILITGASSDIGFSLLKSLSLQDYLIGAHCNKNCKKLSHFIKKFKLEKKIKIFKSNLSHQKECHNLVSKFLSWTATIDALIQLHGNVSKVINWKNLKQKDFERDLQFNLSSAFFLSQKVFKTMEKHGGKIIFMGTSSAFHGGGENSLGYGIGKTGIICLTKGLARFGAKKKIIVNAVAPGYINTKFHTKTMGRTKNELKKRAKLSKLNRPGTPEEVANLINFLLSDQNNYITGEVIPIDGGDWI